MSTYLDARQAIVSIIKGRIPALVTVEPHGGRFDERELRRHAKRAPAVLVACLGVPEIGSQGGASVSTLQWGAFLVMQDKPAEPRDAQALVLVEALLQVIDDECWGGMAQNEAEGLRADNLYSAGLDGQGIALWALTWRQDFEHRITGTLDDLARIIARYDFAPVDGRIEAEDHINMQTEGSG